MVRMNEGELGRREKEWLEQPRGGKREAPGNSPGTQACQPTEDSGEVPASTSVAGDIELRNHKL